MPPSITTWHRYEPSPHGARLADALQARLHDPLWLLGRQWQVGEFIGDDAGSPVGVRLGTTTHPIRAWAPGAVAPGSSAPGLPFNPNREPLEPLVQAEPAHAVARPPWEVVGDAARAGLDWLQAMGAVLAAAGLAGAAIDEVRADLREQYPLDVPDVTGLQHAGAASAVWLRAAARRSFDGLKFAAALRAHLVSGASGMPAPAPSSGTEDVVRDAAERWLARWEASLATPAAPAAWDAARLEYRFSMSSSTGSAERTVVAPSWTGERMDWHTFDAAPGSALPTGGSLSPAVNAVHERLPTQATFPGAPLPRWWSFESAAVSFAAVDAGPDELARLLVLEYALVYGNDFFLVPLTLPVGSMTSIDTLVVTDTFGIRTLVEPASAHSHRPWTAWTLTVADGTAVPSTPPGLLIAPTLVEALTGPPLEEVRLLRDEMADVVWAIERTVRDAAHRPVDRAERSAAGRRSATQDPPAADALPRYRIAASPPEFWYPMAPTPDTTGTMLSLQVLPDPETGQLSPPRGELLGGSGLTLYEEEVGREGVDLVRHVRRARGGDRSTQTWIARRRGVGRGEGSSGQVFDRLDLRP